MNKITVILSVLGIVLGSSVISTLITQFWVWRRDVSNEKKQFLEQQIQKLYGPMFWYLSRCEEALKLSRKIQEAGTKEYAGKDCRAEDVDKTIGVSNEYVAVAKYNSTRALDILNENYAFIDLDDIDIFNLFFEHYIRSITEFSEKGLKIPLNVYEQMGDISFLRNECIDRIKEKYLSKREKWSGVTSR